MIPPSFPDQGYDGFVPFTGFDPCDGDDPRVPLSRSNPINNSAAQAPDGPEVRE